MQGIRCGPDVPQTTDPQQQDQGNEPRQPDATAGVLVVRYAGHALHCEFALAALAGAHDDPPPRSPMLHVGFPRSLEALQSRGDWRHVWEDTYSAMSMQVGLSDPGYVLRFQGHCDFHLDPQTGRVEIDALSDLDADTLEHLLIDQALPRLLSHLGHAMLHASVVRIGNRGALFLGRSGWGKSTLAGLLHRRGHAALCDDCALLELHDGQAYAIPAYPGLRLYDDSIREMFADAPTTAPVADYSDKQRVIGLPVSPGTAAGQPLDAIYLLCDPAESDGRLSLERLAPAAVCMALVEHSFRLDPSAREQSRLQLRQAAALAHAIPAFELRHPHDFTRQDEVISILLAHFASLAKPPASGYMPDPQAPPIRPASRNA